LVKSKLLLTTSTYLPHHLQPSVHSILLWIHNGWVLLLQGKSQLLVQIKPMVQNQFHQPSRCSMVGHPWVLLLYLMGSHIKGHHPLSFSSSTSRALLHMDHLEDHHMRTNNNPNPFFSLALLLQGSHIMSCSIEVL
jgi:hypothetical protein